MFKILLFTVFSLATTVFAAEIKFEESYLFRNSQMLSTDHLSSAEANCLKAQTAEINAIGIVNKGHFSLNLHFFLFSDYWATGFLLYHPIQPIIISKNSDEKTVELVDYINPKTNQIMEGTGLTVTLSKYGICTVASSAVIKSLYDNYYK